MSYSNKLITQSNKVKNFLCIGIDPYPECLPLEVQKRFSSLPKAYHYFCNTIIEQTHHHCVAYKFNIAFFEALGSAGIRVFEDLIKIVPSTHITIADAKRGDIGHSNSYYAKAAWDVWQVDAITLNPLMGLETFTPFLNNPNKCIYILTLTSNIGAGDIFLQPLKHHLNVSHYIADSLSKLQKQSKTSLGMVLGATQSQHFLKISQSFNNSPLLIPGIGIQQADISHLSHALHHHRGIPLLNVSRSIILTHNVMAWKKQLTSNAIMYHEKLYPIWQNYHKIRI